MATLMMQLAVGMATERKRPPDFVNERARRCWEMIEARLGAAPFFGGQDLTTADIMMFSALTTGRVFRGTSIAEKPNLLAYLQRIGERPA